MDERKSHLDELCLARVIRAAAQLSERTEAYMQAQWNVCMRKHGENMQRALIEFLVQLAA